MARKSKYMPETVAKIIEAIKMGATYELAAFLAGRCDVLALIQTPPTPNTPPP